MSQYPMLVSKDSPANPVLYYRGTRRDVHQFAYIGMALIALVFGVIVGSDALRGWMRVRQIDTAQTVTATYTDQHVSGDSSSTARYWHYEYRVGGVTYRGAHRVRQDVYNDFVAGEQVTVYYLPSEPGFSFTSPSALNTSTTAGLVMAGVPLVLGVLVVLRSLVIIALTNARMRRGIDSGVETGGGRSLTDAAHEHGQPRPSLRAMLLDLFAGIVSNGTMTYTELAAKRKQP